MKKLMLIAAAICMAGCAETAGTRVTIDTESGNTSVVECAPRIAERINVIGITYSEVSEGIKRATVTIESKAHKRLQYQARMIWLDAEGVEIDPDSKSFRPIVLDGMDQIAISGVAPNSRAVKAKLQIRVTSTAQ